MQARRVLILMALCAITIIIGMLLLFYDTAKHPQAYNNKLGTNTWLGMIGLILFFGGIMGGIFLSGILPKHLKRRAS